MEVTFSIYLFLDIYPVSSSRSMPVLWLASLPPATLKPLRLGLKNMCVKCNTINVTPSIFHHIDDTLIIGGTGDWGTIIDFFYTIDDAC